MTTIYFVRHGTVYNPNEIFYGRLPHFGLSAQGLRQAQAAGHLLQDKPIRAAFSSPMLRARQTARVIAQALGQSKVFSSGYLNEVSTPYEGCPLQEMVARNWDLYTGTQPPYEQPADVFKRTMKFIRSVLKNYPGQQVVAVTHGDTIVFLSLWAHGYPVDYPNKSLIEHGLLPISYPSPASITCLTWESTQSLPSYSYLKGQD